jgi:geranylgeranyl diphosphate synthase type II
MLSELEPNTFKAVVKSFNKCAAEVCEGQQWDMEFETQRHVSERSYLNMIKLKTAVLLGFSLELGAILAGASVNNQVALRNFGINIGIGFQLKDDLLDAFADPKKFGKQVGGDIIANKKTFLLIKARERATGKTKAVLERWLQTKKFDKKEKIEVVKDIYTNLDLPAITGRKINSFFSKGFKNLERVKGRAEKKALLYQFTQALVGRQS